MVFSVPFVPNQQRDPNANADLVVKNVATFLPLSFPVRPRISLKINVVNVREIHCNGFLKPSKATPLTNRLFVTNAHYAIASLQSVGGPPKEFHVGVRESVLIAGL